MEGTVLRPPGAGFPPPMIYVIVFIVTVTSTVHGQSTCQSEICSESGFGLFCAEGGVLHINHVRCGHHDPESCSVAKHNLMTMCTGQKACAAKGLRKILRPCQTRPWSSVFVRVNYSCVPEAILTRTCSGDMEEEIGNRGAIIMSPGYPDSPTDVKYNFCHWAFSVPVWQNARLSIQHLTSRQHMGRCDSPLLQISYTMCNGGGVKTEKYCGVIRKEKVRRACGRVRILAKGFDPQYDAGTKFLLSVNVDYPQNLDVGRGNPMYTIPCGGEPTTAPSVTLGVTVPAVDLLSISGTTEGEQQKRSGGLISTADDSKKKSSPQKMSRTLKMVLVLTLAGIIIIILIAAIAVVCHKTVQSGNYKLREAEALAIARRRSKESEATKFDHVGMNGHKPGKCSIEDIDEDLVINGLRDDRCENSPTKQHYMTIDDDDTGHLPNGGGGGAYPGNRPDVVDHTYSSYASIDDDASALTSLDSGYPRTALYEDPDDCRNGHIPPHNRGLHGDGDSLDGEYDNIPRTADVLADVEHYSVDGDDYAIVTKPRKVLPRPGVMAENGPRQGYGGTGGVNGGYHVTPKPVYVNKSGNVVLLDSRINNHISLGDEGEMIY